jgi:predicted acetyltransferase
VPIQALEYTPALDLLDAERYAKLLARVFCWPEPWSHRWVQAQGQENIRVVRRNGVVAGGLMLMPMREYFGGRPVSLTGISTVIVAPEQRGGGVGTTLMREAVLEMHRSGAAISGLYPATIPVYRGCGYEFSGVRCEVKINLKLAKVTDAPGDAKDLTVEPYAHADEPAVRALYNFVAPSIDGHLDRPESIWTLKVYAHRGEPTSGFVVRRGQTIIGYVFLLQQRVGLNPFDIVITDLVAPDPAAAWRLMAFLGDHWSIAGEARWMTSPHHPALLHFRDRCCTTTIADHWMLRVLNVAKAFESRGYAPELSGQASFVVRDPLIAENSGRYTLRVQDGRGSIEIDRSESATASPSALDIRALAPILSGYATAPWLQSSGLVPTLNDDIHKLTRLCALPTPWMSEIY